jgi:hypothetical protein
MVGEVVIDLLLAGHLFAMNMASAGPLVALCVAWRRDADDVRRAAARRVARLALMGLAIGAALGGAMLLAPSEGMRAALGRFPASAYWFGLAELLFTAACMLGLMRAIARQWPRWTIGLLTAASVLNLLYHFPPWMAVIGELAADRQWASAEVIDRRALLSLWTRPEILSVWAHFVLASLAVAPVAALWACGESLGGRGGDLSEGIVRALGGWALAATVLQLPVGLWMLAARGAAAREAILGGALGPTFVFGGAVLAVLGLMQALLGIVMGEGEHAVRRAGWLVVLVTVLMAGTLRAGHFARARKNSPDLARSGLLGSLARENAVVR